MRALTQALALHPVPGLLRNRPFLWALVAALPVWAAMAPLWPERSFQLPGVWPFIYMVLLSPALEELAFRGALQGWLNDYPWGRYHVAGLSLANGITTVLFTASHLFNHPPLWALAVLAPSLLFGYFRDRTGSVLPGFLLHGWYNAGYLLLIA